MLRATRARPETQITHTRGGRQSLVPVYSSALEKENEGANASWRKITNGKQNYRVLPRRNLEAIGAFVGSISAVSRVRSLILPGGWVWAHFPEQRLVIEPKPLERIYGRFSSIDPPGCFAGVPNLGEPLYREKTVYLKTQKTAINLPVDYTWREEGHVLSKISCFLLKSFHFRRLQKR